jgi:hypothetical protein
MTRGVHLASVSGGKKEPQRIRAKSREACAAFFSHQERRGNGRVSIDNRQTFDVCYSIESHIGPIEVNFYIDKFEKQKKRTPVVKDDRKRKEFIVSNRRGTASNCSMIVTAETPEEAAAVRCVAAGVASREYVIDNIPYRASVERWDIDLPPGDDKYIRFVARAHAL